MPIFTEMAKVFPPMQACIDQMNLNRECWMKVEAEHKQKQQEFLRARDQAAREMLQQQQQQQSATESGQGSEKDTKPKEHKEGDSLGTDAKK